MLKAIAWRVEITLIGAVVVWQAVSTIMYAFNLIRNLFS